jgi:putative SOS response-associated peptidase YedK
MCNRYGIRAPLHSMAEELSQLKIPLVFPPRERWPNFPVREDIRPTNIAPVLRPVDGGVELVELRWGLIPWFHKKTVKEWKALTTNCRSETVGTTATFKGAYARRRCLVPATHFFEWTGEKGAKTKWRFNVKGREWFCFPGLWDRAETPEGPVESFTLLTCAPGPDAEPYHNRQPVILKPATWAQWLCAEDPCTALLAAGEAGELVVERAD